MIVIIDNYDSFVHNLADYVRSADCDVRILKNDEMTSDEVAALNPEAVILSPGPCRPEQAGICVDFIQKYAAYIPILGVCLGHQAIGYAFGTKIEQCDPVHGRADLITHDG